MNPIGIAVARPVGLALLLSGCSDDLSSPNEQPDLSVLATAELLTTIDTMEDLRRLGRVEVLQVRRSPGESSCTPIPSGIIATVDGAPMAWEIDPRTNCSSGSYPFWLTEGVQSIVVQVLRGGTVVGSAQFDRMAPGMDARLVSPSDGIVHAGDEMVIVPPPELPTSSVSDVRFYPYGSDPWAPRGIRSDQDPLRQADGIHAWVPAFTGRAAMVVGGTPLFPPVVVSACDGFLTCSARADYWLGPFELSEVP